jgi:surfeit locus 1 family protein
MSRSLVLPDARRAAYDARHDHWSPNPEGNPDRTGSASHVTEYRRPSGLAITIPGLVGTVLVFVVAAACVRLGFWQLDRLEQRRARNVLLAARMDAPVVDLTPATADTAGLRFRTAAAAGEWDGTRTIVFPGRAFRGVPGVHVLTPLRMGSGAAVLVNRGWVPAADAATIDTSFFTLSDSARVSGLILAFPGTDESLAQRAGPVPDSGFRRVWFSVDEAALRRQFPYRLLDLELRLQHADDRASGYPLPLPPPVLDEGPHLGYALQWFAFALIAVGGWLAMVLHSRLPGSRAREARAD